MSEHVTWPLWICISPESLAKLFVFQWDKYGYRLEIPALKLNIGVVYPSLEEIDKTMRQRPHGMKRVT